MVYSEVQGKIALIVIIKHHKKTLYNHYSLSPMSQSHHCHNLRVQHFFQGISAQGEGFPKLHSCFLVKGDQVGRKPLQAVDSETKWN